VAFGILGEEGEAKAFKQAAVDGFASGPDLAGVLGFVEGDNGFAF